jgi:hypothetical protein
MDLYLLKLLAHRLQAFHCTSTTTLAVRPTLMYSKDRQSDRRNTYSYTSERNAVKIKSRPGQVSVARGDTSKPLGLRPAPASRDYRHRDEDDPQVRVFD